MDYLPCPYKILIQNFFWHKCFIFCPISELFAAHFMTNLLLNIGKKIFYLVIYKLNMDRVKWIWYLSPMRAAKVQASLRIRTVSPEPPLLAHTSIESRGTFRQKTRSLAPLNGWACAVKICHDGMLEDTNSPDGAHIVQENAFSEASLSTLGSLRIISYP